MAVRQWLAQSFIDTLVNAWLPPIQRLEMEHA